MKTCNKCKIEKPFDAFAWKENIKNKRDGICKQCKVESNQLRQFNMTTKMALEITNNCQLCAKSLENTKVCIDHDHITNVVRGILCNSCNVGLGLLGDNIEGLEKALNYLKNPPMPSK